MPISKQEVAVMLCGVTRDRYREYSVRTQTASVEGAPQNDFREDLFRKYGPAGDWDPHLATRCSLHAYIYLSVAEQHLSGLQTLLAHNSNGLSIGPAARSVAEASGRVLWLLDNRLRSSGTDARRRVARFLLDDEENARNHKRIAYAFDDPNRHKSGDSHRVAKDLIRKPGIFWPSEIEINATNGHVRLCGETLPGPSKFVRLAGEIFGDPARETAGYYAYMSAMTHPSVFAFIETLEDIAKLPEGFTTIPLSEDGDFPLKVALNATRAFHNAWRAWISWTATGMQEAEAVHDAHWRVSEMVNQE